MFPLFSISDILIKISNGKITKANVIPTTKLELKSLKNSTIGSAETKTRKCNIVPSNAFSKEFEYGLKI